MHRKSFLAILLLATGCATIHNGRHQEINVVSNPAGANVEVHCGKTQSAGVTPMTVRLPRRVEDCSLVLTRPGFRSERVVFESTPSKWFWANFAGPIAGGVSGATRHSDQTFIDFLIGAVMGGIGFGVDAISGAMWELQPSAVSVELQPD